MKTFWSNVVRLIACVTLLCGCGSQTMIEQPAQGNPAAAPGETAVAQGDTSESGSQGATAATSPAETTPPSPAKPATPAEAAKVIDLRTFPLVSSTSNPPSRSLAQLSYIAQGTPQDALKSIKATLAEQKWKELPGSYESDQGGNGTFARDGYKLSVSVYSAGKPGEVSVSMINHGNIDTQALPTPEGVKALYSTPVSTAWVTEATPADTVAAVRKLLLAQGWEPYGGAGDSQYFKQNAVQLTATVASAPGQGGKTVLDYSTRLLSADIPLPPDAVQVQFSDTPTQLAFDVDGDYETVSKFYRDTLAKHGWEATTENLVKIDWKHFLIFRNKALDLLEVQLTTVDDKTRALVRFQTAAEVAALEKAAKEAAERKIAEANKPKPKLAIKLPAGAAGVKVSSTSIEFTVPIGKAKAAVETVQKQLVDAGWKPEEGAKLETMFGTLSLKKENQSVSITYVESGVLAPEITISGSGVELEQAKEGR